METDQKLYESTSLFEVVKDNIKLLLSIRLVEQTNQKHLSIPHTSLQKQKAHLQIQYTNILDTDFS